MPISKNSSIATKSLASTHPSTSPTIPPTHGERANGRMHKRSRSGMRSALFLFLFARAVPKLATLNYANSIGCFTCRLRRKKCDENHPACSACLNLNVRCEYKRPVWWANAEQRRAQKERIKNKIKQTKMLERNGNNYSGLCWLNSKLLDMRINLLHFRTTQSPSQYVCNIANFTCSRIQSLL